MNPRRVHDLMSQKFPEVRAASRDWVVVTDDNGLRRGALQALIEQYIRGTDVLVEASRKVGDFVPALAAVDFVAQHIGQGEIRLADREFTGFVVVAVNGVATGWSAQPSR
jgi:hypothetical protein